MGRAPNTHFETPSPGRPQLSKPLVILRSPQNAVVQHWATGGEQIIPNSTSPANPLTRAHQTRPRLSARPQHRPAPTPHLIDVYYLSHAFPRQTNHQQRNPTSPPTTTTAATEIPAIAPLLRPPLLTEALSLTR
ncbi:Hypothetical protein GSB_151176 [Giardia duodenalis]|uniref:Uncharacterized protein n=1 Tax=Giardia intestinalis TaxID=5741 RepID=V6TTZ1_GIAIN|nr:Hypothetical protein GSB_151176 [Giardia intestinalis]